MPSPIKPFPYGSSSALATEFAWRGDALSPENQSALNVGAPMWYSNGYWCDTLDVPDSTAEARDRLQKWWGVGDAVELRQTIGRLLDGMHSSGFEIAQALAAKAIDKADGHDPDTHREFLRTRAVVLGKHTEYLVRSYDAIYQLRTMKILSSAITSEFPTHIRAWDLARIPFLARAGKAAGFVDESECWPMLHAGLASARGYYANWRQFAHGYVVGRAYWAALDDVSTATDYGKTARNWVNSLLVRSDSPWRRLPLRAVGEDPH